MRLPLERVLMDPNTGALGYGLEYTYSVMERLRLAALMGDAMTQQPMICNVGEEAWRQKESRVPDGRARGVGRARRARRGSGRRSHGDDRARVGRRHRRAASPALHRAGAEEHRRPHDAARRSRRGGVLVRPCDRLGVLERRVTAMALTGLEIYKLLPKTNCKECGFPTCLAFAMKLAQKGTELDKCPYVTDETRAALDAASAPPIKLITVGAGERAFSVGNETVLYRHEKTFFNQPGLGVRLADDDPDLAAHAAARRRLRRRARRHDAAPRLHRARERLGRRGHLRARRRPRPPPPTCRWSSCASDATAMGAALAEVRAGTAAPARRHAGQLAGDGRARQAARLPAGHPRRRRRPRRPSPSSPTTCAAPGSRTSSSTPAPVSLGRWPGGLHAASPAGAQEELPALRVPPHRLRRRRDGRRPRPSLRHPGDRQVRRPRRARPLGQAEGLPAAHAAAEHLHRPAEADPGRAEALRRSASRAPTAPLLITTNFSLTYFSVSGEVEGAGRAGLAARRRRRRPVGAHRLGRRQVRRREDRQDGQGLGRRRQAQRTRSWSSPATSPASRARPRRSCRAGRSWWGRARRSTSRAT